MARMDEAPIFIVGSMRSGSTMLRLILDSHPRIAIGAETGFMGGLLATRRIPGWKHGAEWFGRIGWTEQELDARLREFYTGMYEYDLKYVYVTLESLQDFLDRGDAVDGIEVRIEDANDTARYIPTDASAGLIREALGPGYRIVDWRELNRSLFSALKLEKIAMFLVLGIVILVASFSIVGNLIMVVIEKAKEIALVKTLGASDVGVMQLFAIQGLLIGLIGTILGVFMGLLACFAAKRFRFPLDPDVYYIDRLPIHVDWQSVAAAGAAGVLISIAATLYPALLAARVRPAAGMRH